MATLGLNPARIIPAWDAFVEENRAPGSRIWGIGEPIWPGRTAAELSECYRHECLLNVAFADADGFTLLCPYDTSSLEPGVVDRARHSHPLVAERGVSQPSPPYRPSDFETPFADVLPQPSADPPALAFGERDLASLRAQVRAFAAAEGLPSERSHDLVLAVHE